MSLLYSTLLLLGLVLAILLPIALSQFDKPKNANKFVDSVSLLFVKRVPTVYDGRFSR